MSGQYYNVSDVLGSSNQNIAYFGNEWDISVIIRYGCLDSDKDNQYEVGSATPGLTGT